MITLLLCGDVMLGRGVDQILAHPGDPTLRERHVGDARVYVDLAERVNGPIPRPVGPTWPWGEALSALDEAGPDVRVLNLETSITRAAEFAPGKAVHYRMAPEGLPALAVARPDVCVLANNHVLDFGRPGLEETLEVLAATGLQTAGAGPDATEAHRPATVALEDGRRVLVFAVGTASSGIPPDWAATGRRSGVAYLAEPSDAGVREIVDRVHAYRRTGDRVVVSIHWGSNWGYDVARSQTRFAHALLEGGVDVIHGHSSHHPRPIEVHRGRLVLYGCGDLIDDYEGIAGHEEFRDDLRLLYLVTLDASTGELVELRMVPLQAKRMRLEHAAVQDRDWLRAVLDSVSRPFGTRVVHAPGDGLALALR
jgi:poly-gamma-glutamate capsule biosynthesis protein CapA/YwtB (metallophosphatase superfamily)